ncbi:hypothetical protein GPECTOR_50g666 [Gonium pectorale]|uniref:Ankyrin repeat domain-containing protein n=1 Tax=Gonium pectorale TaxID=33097 RepID=A0A150G7Q1_GONPE|nr:hypothetical protein GPECTOR_50g666 [Gonium pectorale]|eukprot:KXZ45872.1 hypothetical protein GPECTOR_50g666 [Gonium pectorale]
MSLAQRQEVISIAAASGDLRCLKAAVWDAGCAPDCTALRAAAAAGQLAVCQWLLRQGCPTSHKHAPASDLLAAAAGGGHLRVCAWLLGLGLVWSSDGAAEAARGGHVELMVWLLKQGQARHEAVDAKGAAEEARRLVEGVAHGCSLAILQCVWLGRWVPQDATTGARALAAAAGSPTPDWAAKVAWLEAQGCRPHTATATAVAAAVAAGSRPGARTRLSWLYNRGYPVDATAVIAAASAGNAGVLSELLALPSVSSSAVGRAAAVAAARGHVAVLEELREATSPCPVCNDPYDMAVQAASAGHLDVLDWIVRTIGGCRVKLDEDLFAAAAGSGSVELMAWLREHGCRWDRRAFVRAAESGCVAAMEWLAERGCPMPADAGWCHLRAFLRSDAATGRCLLRLGLAWGSFADHLLPLLEPEAALRWALEVHCPATARCLREAEAEGEGAARRLLNELVESR